MKMEVKTYRKDLQSDRIYPAKEKFFNARRKTIILISISLLFIAYIFIHGSLINEDMLQVEFQNKLKGPSVLHIFGTDAKGRDMYLRTVIGLCISLQVGIIASGLSILIAILLSLCLAGSSKRIDGFINWLIDVFLSIPHMMFLILISVAVGRGLKGVVIGIALTHWTGITRLIRAEIKQIKEENFLKISKALGKSNLYIALNHVLPHLLPQILVGAVLLFPHAILHESAISFLGFGLDITKPSIGIILQESMTYLARGYYYLAFFPGLMLVLIVLAINGLGENLRKIFDPYSYHE